MIISSLKKALKQLYPQRASTNRLEKELLQQEAALGASLFGPIPKGQLREFVCLDEKTILWYESKGPDGKSLTTRYEVYSNRIIKIQDGQPHQLIPEQEGQTLLTAVRWYHYLMTQKLYPAAS